MEGNTDILLVGAGPIGIEMAVALKLNGFSFRHVEAGAIGQTISWYAPGTHFFSSPERIQIAGHPLITPDQQKATTEVYLDYLRSVVDYHKLTVETFRRVTEIATDAAGFKVTTVPSALTPPADFLSRPAPELPGEIISCKRIILAIGDMHKPLTLEIEGEDLPHVSHYLQSPHRYYGRNVTIVGGKNSAVEAAIRLFRAGARVTISYRQNEFDSTRVKYWLLPELHHLIHKKHITFLPGTVPVKIDDRTISLSGSEGMVTVPADNVLLLTGYSQVTDLFEKLGVELKGITRHPAHSRQTMETDISGVYVAGTAAAGTQIGGVKYFIENCHVHAERIIAALTGRILPLDEVADNEGFLEN